MHSIEQFEALRHDPILQNLLKARVKEDADRQTLQYEALRATIPQLATCDDTKLFFVVAAVMRPETAMQWHHDRIAKHKRSATMSVDEIKKEIKSLEIKLKSVEQSQKEIMNLMQ